jgi:hypothetical protein
VIIRSFRVRARPGRAAELERVVRERGVPNIAWRDGLLSGRGNAKGAGRA